MNIDLTARPSDWKKLVVTIWKAATQNTQLAMGMPCSQAAMRVVSVVKIIATYLGKKTLAMVPSRHATVPTTMVSQ